MKILIIGNGAREHAIGWNLFNSPSNHDIFVAPGNAGTDQFAKNVDIDSNNIPELLDFAKSSSAINLLEYFLYAKAYPFFTK